MNHFTYQNQQLHAENVPLAEIAARYGTPCFVYSRAALEEQFLSYQKALQGRDHLICYAVKANSNLAVLNVLAQLGAGFDIVSGGELARVLAAGGSADKVIFSGVGKTVEEMEQALEAGIHCFNVESLPELERLSAVASHLEMTARISLRVNPDVDAGTHPYISTGLKENKFGVDIAGARAFYQRARELPGIEIIGVDCHIGSQLTDIDPYQDALDRLLTLIDGLQEDGVEIRHLDLGGGLGVRYQDETPPTPEAFINTILPRLEGRNMTLVFEPGRSICANAGVMLTRVEYLKETDHKKFAIVDSAMNDIIRPALYQSFMDIIPVFKDGENKNEQSWDIVGPICESGDFLGRDRHLALAPNDLLAMCSAGAYCFTMSSNYNTRNRAAEIMVDGSKHQVVRRRESFDDQIALESVMQNIRETGE